MKDNTNLNEKFLNYCLKGNLIGAKIMLMCGADSHYIKDGQTILEQSISKGVNPKVVKFLLETCKLDPNVYSGDDSLLVYSVKSNQLKVVKLLIEHGANVSKDLLYAIKQDNKRLVDLLVEYCEADINAHNSSGKSHLINAIEDGDLALVELLLKFGANPNTKIYLDIPAIVVATNYGNMQIVDRLLCNGANVNDTDSYGVTPLMASAKLAKADMFFMLLARGAKMNKVDWYGNTALMYANNMEVVKYLVENHCPLNADKRYTPLMFISNPEVAQYWLDHGVNIDQKDPSGQSALIGAILHRNFEMASFLLKHSANVNLQDSKGRTPLMHAARLHKNSKEFVDLLLSYNANVDAKDNEGKTTLMFAARERNKEAAETLLKAGADPKLKDYYGFTALDYSKKWGEITDETGRLLQKATIKATNKSSLDK